LDKMVLSLQCRKADLPYALEDLNTDSKQERMSLDWPRTPSVFEYNVSSSRCHISFAPPGKNKPRETKRGASITRMVVLEPDRTVDVFSPKACHERISVTERDLRRCDSDLNLLRECSSKPQLNGGLVAPWPSPTNAQTVTLSNCTKAFLAHSEPRFAGHVQTLDSRDPVLCTLLASKLKHVMCVPANCAGGHILNRSKHVGRFEQLDAKRLPARRGLNARTKCRAKAHYALDMQRAMGAGIAPISASLPDDLLDDVNSQVRVRSRTGCSSFSPGRCASLPNLTGCFRHA